MFPRRENSILKRVTIKGKTIFFHARVAPIRKENNFRGHKIKKTPELKYASLTWYTFKIAKFDAANITVL